MRVRGYVSGGLAGARPLNLQREIKIGDFENQAIALKNERLPESISKERKISEKALTKRISKSVPPC